jgi:Rod binding domain-containing protein
VSTIVNSVASSQQPLTADQKKALANLHTVSQQMEGIFVNMLFEQMRKGESDDTLFGERSNGEKIYESMLDQERSKEIAKTGAFGIGAMIEAQLRPAVLANAETEAKSSTRGLLP